jgi:hypothetical protein
MTPTPPPEVTIGGRVLRPVWNRVARYRLSSLGADSPGGFAASCNILWAADPARTYATPEALAAAMTDGEEDAALAAVESLVAAATDEKKSSSPIGPSPGSTSESPPPSGSHSTTTPSTPS